LVIGTSFCTTSVTWTSGGLGGGAEAFTPPHPARVRTKTKARANVLNIEVRCFNSDMESFLKMAFVAGISDGI
jgi:hypothetical protein